MKKIKSIFLCCLLALSFGVANADGFSLDKYFGLGFGQSIFNDFNDDLSSTQTAEDKDTAFKLFYGLKLHKHFAVEFEYNDLGKYSLTTTDYQTTDDDNLTTNYDTTDTSEFKNIGISAVVKGMITSRIQWFGKLGVHHWNSDVADQSILITKTDEEVTTGDTTTTNQVVTIGDTTTANNSYKGTDVFGGVGFNYHLGEHSFARIEYERFKFDNDDVGVKDSDLISASYIYKF